jgi:hypothetical protein
VSSCRVPSVPLKSFRRNCPLRWACRLQIDTLLPLLVSDLGRYVDTNSQMPASPITSGADALSVSFGKQCDSAPIVRRGLEDQDSGTCENMWR